MRLLFPIMAAGLFGGEAIAHCGGSFHEFVNELRSEAIQKGNDPADAHSFFASVRHDPEVIKADRRQGIFQLPFVEFSGRLMSDYRLNAGVTKSRELDRLFDGIWKTYGVSRGILLALWAFESDFGAVQGEYNTLNALVTLSHDCRRPELFRPQIFAALELYQRGDFSPTGTTGAWAGEYGMVQMLPMDVLMNGVDGDGDGKVDLKASEADALSSGAKMLLHLGWRAREPWLQEVRVPQNFDWSLTGLDTTKSTAEWKRMGVRPRFSDFENGLSASLILPQGRKGPAFLAYPNLKVLLQWNESFIYVVTVGHFAARFIGVPLYDSGSPEAGLTGQRMIELQKRLASQGHDVGKIDGILGRKTRAAVRDAQRRLGLPADGWPTEALLSKL